LKTFFLWPVLVLGLVGCTTGSSYQQGIDDVLRAHGAAERLSPPATQTYRSGNASSWNPGLDAVRAHSAAVERAQQTPSRPELSLDEILKLQQIVNNAFPTNRRGSTPAPTSEQLSCTQNGWLLQCQRGRQQISCTRNGSLIQCSDGSSCQANGSLITCN
jgi:hypothetical protein